MNKKANWTLPAIFGIIGAGLIVVPLLPQSPLSKWFIPLGIIFIVLAFLANR